MRFDWIQFLKLSNHKYDVCLSLRHLLMKYYQMIFVFLIITIVQVAIEHWAYFLSDACINDKTFNVGEFFHGDPAILGEYQPVLDSVLGYPMYYTMQDVFGRKRSMKNIDDRLLEYQQNFKDYAALGLFTDNHDNRRWLCDYPDITNYKNALLFMHTFPGIPYG